MQHGNLLFPELDKVGEYRGWMSLINSSSATLAGLSTHTRWARLAGRAPSLITFLSYLNRMETNHANSSDIGGTDATNAASNLPEATSDQSSGTTAGSAKTGASTAGASTTGTTTTGASTAGASQSSGNTNSGDGKNWMDFANPQNLQKIVDQLPQGVRDFCTNSWNQVNTQVGKMSTTQKVAGAVALVGLGYLALRPGKSKSSRGSSKKNKNYRGSWDSTYRGSSYGSSTGARSGSGYGSSYGDQEQSRSGASYDSGSGSLGSSYGSGSGAGYGTGSSAGTGSGAGSDTSSASGSEFGSLGSAGDATYRGGNLGSSSSAGRDYSSDI